MQSRSACGSEGVHMRRDKDGKKDETPEPPGGRALERLHQFEGERGLPLTAPDAGEKSGSTKRKTKK